MTPDQARPGFNHNYAYHRYLLRQVPPGCDRALDAGCGTACSPDGWPGTPGWSMP